MGALARVYGLYWTKEGAAKYTLHARETDELQTSLWRLGRGGDFLSMDPFWGETIEETQQNRELEQQVVDELQGKGANASQGAAFSALPEDLQLRVREVIEAIAANQLISEYQVATRLLTDETTLTISRKIYPDSANNAKVSSQWNVALSLPTPEGKAEYAQGLLQTTLYAPPVPRPQNEVPTPPAP